MVKDLESGKLVIVTKQGKMSDDSKDFMEGLVKTWETLSPEQREKIAKKLRSAKLASDLPSAVAEAYKEVTGATSLAASRFESEMTNFLGQLKVQLKQEADEIVERAQAIKVAIDEDDFDSIQKNLEYVAKILKSMQDYVNLRQDSVATFAAKMFERLRRK